MILKEKEMVSLQKLLMITPSSKINVIRFRIPNQNQDHDLHLKVSILKSKRIQTRIPQSIAKFHQDTMENLHQLNYKKN